MASNIIVGSLIACKILISDPSVEKLEESKASQRQQISQVDMNTNSTASRLLRQAPSQFNKKIGEEKVESKIKNEEGVDLVIGKVLEIDEKDYWRQLENGKYRKEKAKMLKVKSENPIDVLYIPETACALYNDLIDDTPKSVKDKEVVKEEIKEELNKKNKKKEYRTEYEEEYIVVPLDYDLKKEGYIEIKDKKIKKKIDKAIISYLNKNDYNIATPKEIKDHREKVKNQNNMLDRVAERQKDLFKKEEKEEEVKVVDTKPIKKEVQKKPSEIKVENKGSFFGGSIIANFEDDLANKIKKEKKETINKEIKVKDSKNQIVKATKEEKIEKKEPKFDNITLMAKAFSYIVKEW